MSPSPLRTDWTRDEVSALYHLPLMELIHRAAATHRTHHDPSKMQLCKLCSIKTGACPEDCSYCGQSAHHSTDLEPEKLLPLDTILEDAKKAKARGCSRFCMGAAWRKVRNNQDFERVLGMVREVRALGLEVCATLGMMNSNQAKKLEEAGLYAYNHNLDTGREYYKKITSTRSYDDRLETLSNVRQTRLTLCSGGIIGLGEGDEDRIDLLHTLCTLPEHPDSVPFNGLVPTPGTPLENQPPVNPWEMIRVIATARLLMPCSTIRLTAGRDRFTHAEQALCFLAGANSIFVGEILLTKFAKLPAYDSDEALLGTLGLTPLQPEEPSFAPQPTPSPLDEEEGVLSSGAEQLCQTF